MAPPKKTPPPPPTQQTPGQLSLSADRRQIIKSDGSPFFWLADTVWALVNFASRADVDYYLGDRASKDYTVIQTILFNDGVHTDNFYGDAQFHNRSIYQPNEAYYQHVDYVLNQANRHGLFVALLPTWGDSVSDPNRRDFDVDSARFYGNYLGQRYKNQPNLIWVLGGDWDSDDPTARAIWRSMAAGLQEGDAGAHLLTYHPRGGSTSSEWYHNDSWLAFNTIQSGHTRNSKNWEMITNDWNKSPAKPVLDFEPNYENFPNGFNPDGERLTQHDVRKKAYWSVFAGAFGATYGAWEVYPLHEGGGSFPNRPHWKEALNYAGATQMRWLRRLMQSRPLANRLPDQAIVTSSTFADTSGNHIRATRAADGSYAMIYTGGGQAFSVNLAKITGGAVEAWWFNPRTGQSHSAGTFANTGTQTFTPPEAVAGQVGNDWVLVLDDASRGYGRPGGNIWTAPAATVPGPITSPPAEAGVTPAKPHSKPKPKPKTPATSVFSEEPIKRVKKPAARTAVPG